MRTHAQPQNYLSELNKSYIAVMRLSDNRARALSQPHGWVVNWQKRPIGGVIVGRMYIDGIRGEKMARMALKTEMAV